MQKLKAPAIRGIQFHNQRERESETNPDIQKERTDLNYDLVNPGPIDYVEAVKNRIEEGVDSNKKIRKDAIRLCEFLITSDKDFFEDLSEDDEKKFFEKGYEFLKDRYGEENIIYAAVHKDERTPHLHVGFVPITEDNRLSAKDLFKKQDLVRLQDDFNKHMNEAGFKLERGVSSNRKHLETAKFKAQTKEEQIKELDQKIKEIEKSMEVIRTHAKDIDSIPAKKTMLGSNVTLKEDDFNEIKALAQSSLIHQKRAVTAEQRVMDLVEEKKDLLEENKDLGKENDKLLSKIKAFEKVTEQQRKLIEQYKEFAKGLVREVYKFTDHIDPKGKLKEAVQKVLEAFEKRFKDEQKVKEAGTSKNGSQRTRERSDDELER